MSSNHESGNQQLSEDSIDNMNGAIAQQLADNIAMLSDLAHSTGSNAQANLVSLRAANKISSRIRHQFRNVIAHLTAEQISTLEQVIGIVNDTIFPSLQAQITEAQTELNDAADDVVDCNTAINDRLDRSRNPGDIGRLHDNAVEEQNTYNNAALALDAATAAENAAETALNHHMALIPAPPACAALPAPRTQTNLDAFFSSNAYVTWYNQQQTAYNHLSDTLDDANTETARVQAIFTTSQVNRENKYCDWKLELTTGCSTLDTCHTNSVAHYDSCRDRGQQALDSAANVYQAGMTITANILFLLGRAEYDENAQYTSPYGLTYPTIPTKAPCDLTPLTASTWTPSITCTLPTQAPLTPAPTPPLTPAPTPPQGPSMIGHGRCAPYVHCRDRDYPQGVDVCHDACLQEPRCTNSAQLHWSYRVSTGACLCGSGVQCNPTGSGWDLYVDP